MDFKIFVQRLSKIKDLPLPGEASHYKMAPKERLVELLKEGSVPKNPRKAAVMALFYPDSNNSTKLLCILRKTYKGVHSNQVAFPGGKVEDNDIDLRYTALRETHEEVGVLPVDVTVLRKLTKVYIPPSNFEVQPFIGLYKNPKPFIMQEAEVAAILEISLTNFMEEANVITKKMTTSYAESIDVPAFKLNDYVVWGATAMMMSEIKMLLKQVL